MIENDRIREAAEELSLAMLAAGISDVSDSYLDHAIALIHEEWERRYPEQRWVTA